MKANTMDHGQCLTDETLTEYLEGGLDPAIKAASEVHLVACDDCRLRLAFFMKTMAEDVTAEEALALQAVSQRWDSGRASRQMPRASGWLRPWRLALSGFVVALLLVVVSVQWLVNRATYPRSAGEVVQLLLSQRRPFEPRISGQPHIGIVRTRGAGGPDIAYEVLAAEMTRLAADSYQMGRFYLLQKDLSRAIAYLEMAEQQVGARPEFHNDLGVAYMESGGEARMEKAAEEFRHALKADPEFTPAVFNLALFYERTGALSQAELQWRRFLQLDEDSPWAGEARSKLIDLTR